MHRIGTRFASGSPARSHKSCNALYILQISRCQRNCRKSIIYIAYSLCFINLTIDASISRTILILHYNITSIKQLPWAFAYNNCKKSHVLSEDLQSSILPLYSSNIFTYVLNCFLFSFDKLLYIFTNSCSSRAYCSMLSRSSKNSVIDIPN